MKLFGLCGVFGIWDLHGVYLVQDFVSFWICCDVEALEVLIWTIRNVWSVENTFWNFGKFWSCDSRIISFVLEYLEFVEFCHFVDRSPCKMCFKPRRKVGHLERGTIYIYIHNHEALREERPSRDPHF